MSTLNPEMDALKTRLKAMWMAGDFGEVAKWIEASAGEFIARLALKPGVCVLDVACGSGNLSIPAARAGAIVTGVDIATNLLEQARARAASEGLSIQFDEGDAENLPYAQGSFDEVVSMYGVMFAPRPELVSSELIRVCRPGGRIALANWTPDGFIGRMFKVTGKHVPPPSNIPSPVRWGDEETVRERLREGVADLQMARRICTFKFPAPPAEVVESFRKYYGPTQRAFAALDADGQAALRRDLEQLWSEHNQATDDSATHVEAEYLEVIALRS
ncbi:MAG TPA: methyltransferase domain-containing protein [Pyrinomonadaceae bacterium]|nr:methyltransferase domain-containing protein [Pyrinomonadaceae bacterium]